MLKKRPFKYLDEKQQAIQIVNHGFVTINNTGYPLIELKIIPGRDSD
jgi:hypothetical protein